jgi:mRNA-degrading endonuclease toxin of MazEF toxin-antitoxin module
MPIAIAAPITTKLEGKEAGNLRMHRIRIPVEQQGRYRLISGEAPLRQVDSLVLTEQVRACAHSRFLGNPVARLDETMMHAIEAGAKFALDFA